MEKRSPRNSTNVRISLAHGLAPALLALALWTSLAGLLHAVGALERLGADVSWLTAFACVVATLAYSVDPELRRALEACGSLALSVAMVVGAIAALAHPAGMLALAPAIGPLGAALCRRALRPRFSSGVAASPGARPGAP